VKKQQNEKFRKKRQLSVESVLREKENILRREVFRKKNKRFWDETEVAKELWLKSDNRKISSYFRLLVWIIINVSAYRPLSALKFCLRCDFVGELDVEVAQNPDEQLEEAALFCRRQALHRPVTYTPTARIQLDRRQTDRVRLHWPRLLTFGEGGSVAEWLACWTQAQKGPGSNRSRDAVG